jgi:hypothetical protein
LLLSSPARSSITSMELSLLANAHNWKLSDVFVYDISVWLLQSSTCNSWCQACGDTSDDRSMFAWLDPFVPKAVALLIACHWLANRHDQSNMIY